MEWTGHVSEPLPPPPPSGSPLSSLIGSGERIAVIDVETTGLYRNDRIVEIAVVTLDEHGTVVDHFETLVDPDRDPGPVHIHGITPSMLARAPRFEDISNGLAARLNGAVVCAHNLSFDTRMLDQEFERCTIAVDWGFGLDTLSATRTRLAFACDQAGVRLHDAHSAAADAHATGQLLMAVAGTFAASPVAASLGPIRARHAPIKPRGTDGVSVIAPTPFVTSLMEKAMFEPDHAPYLLLLEVALADLKLTDDERHELHHLAASLGLDDHQIKRAHHDLLDQMINAAIADAVVTPGEQDQLYRAAALLEIDPSHVDRHTEQLRSTQTELPLTVGMTVCFTGSALDADGNEIPRSDLELLATAAGLTPANSVTKSRCNLLVAADPASRSGKAGKARSFGIPIASVASFLASLDTGRITVEHTSPTGIPLVCGNCGGSWIATRRRQDPLCLDCT